MAEARVAVSVSTHTKADTTGVFNIDAEGITIRIPSTLYSPAHIAHASVKHAHRFVNRVVSVLWPVPPAVVALIMALFTAFVTEQPLESWWRSGPVATFLWNYDSVVLGIFCPNALCSLLPTKVRVGYLAAMAALLTVTALMLLQRLFLRVLLSYHGWMFERRRGVLTTLWGLALKAFFLGGRKPLMYSFQRALPRLFVPSVSTTVTTFLASVKPLLPKDEFERIATLASEFQAKAGLKANALLWAKSWWAPNYVSDWWLKYVYLRGRTPLFIGSNYYGIGYTSHVPTTNQAARAASMASYMLEFAQLIDRELLEPMLIQGIVPLCMAQYEVMFSTTRVPGKEIDTIKHYSSWESKHFCVLYNGVYYAVQAAGKFDGKKHGPAKAAHLQLAFEGIIANGNGKGDAGPAGRVSALTTQERTKWATDRETFFSSGVNRASLAEVEKAMFVIAIDPARPADITERGRLLFHGTGVDRWVDKSMTFVVFADGSTGLHAEHSWGDAPAAAHCMEYFLSTESYRDSFQTDGNVIGYSELKRSISKQGAATWVPKVTQLMWEIDEPMGAAIQTATETARAAIADIDLLVYKLEEFGKGFMKNAGVPPDGFIQMALQLAYFRDTGAFGLTYESAMTRLFLHGRTETIRSLSDTSCAFVKAMGDATLSNEAKRQALVAAANVHQTTSRKAMTGGGVDRHLFGLYVACMGLGIESPFLKAALSIPWKLSTSQLPQKQTTLPLGEGGSKKYGSPSGGFAPVHDDGYGVSYMIVDDDQTYFHVSSKHSSPHTSSPRFVAHLHAAFVEMRALWDGVEFKKGKGKPE